MAVRRVRPGVGLRCRRRVRRSSDGGGGSVSGAARTDRGVRPWAYAFLVLILCLVAYAVVVADRYGDRLQHPYMGLVVPLMLLFNHIAFQFTKTGWPSKVMKGIAFAWLAFGLVYLYWVVNSH